MMGITLDEIRQHTRAIEEAVGRNGYGDVGEHADRIVELTSTIRQASVDLRSDADVEYIREQLDRIQHAAHELEEEAGRRSHDGTHHALENINAELDRLKARVDRM
jgi:archaellum component FlaC